jgi:LacI family transcriptional regulator
VVNGRGETSPATRAQVLAAVAALDYRPNVIARGLRARRTRTVGVVVPDIANPFFPEIVQGIEAAASAAGHAIFLCNATEDAGREAEMLRLLEDRRVDGVIVCSPRQDDAPLLAGLRRHPAAVVINRIMPAEAAGVIRVDYAQAARLSVEHFWATGRHRIGMIAAPASSRGGQERRAGFAAAGQQHGFDASSAVIRNGPPTVDGGRTAAAALIAAQPDLDALLCYNDLMAAGALAALKSSGRRVPDDVAVIGCDDILFAGLFSPALTTFRIDKSDIGTLAMRLLLERMAGKTYQPHIVFQPRLVVRDSAPAG